MSLNKLSLLVALSLAFTACDGDDPAPSTEGGTAAGAAPGGTAAGTTPGGATPGGATPGGATPGGATPGGATPGGATPGGATPGGATPGGVDGGAMTGGTTPPVEERVGLGDTAALGCSGAYCPSARLTGLTIPADAAAATAGGCRLAGSTNGTALGGLLALTGGVDTNSFVQPDENGEISLVLINQLKGWDAGLTGNAAGELLANFYTGARAAGGAFEIDPVSLQDDGTPYISFPGTTVTDGLLRTPTSTFTVNLPILDGVDLAVRLDQAKLEGDVSVDMTGFNLGAGVLGGYLTKDGVIELIQGLITACTSPMPPAALSGPICTAVGTDANETLETLSFLAPFDTLVEEGAPAAGCAAADCNALSVCLLVEMSSVTVTGVAMP